MRLWSCWSAPALDAHGRDAYASRTFAQRSDGEQDRIIAGMESGSLRLPGVSAAPFFETLLQDTRNGFFADPIYGGNRDMAAWKMIGFPAPAAIIATGSSGIMRATPTAGQHCRTQCMVPTTTVTVVSKGRFAARLGRSLFGSAPAAFLWGEDRPIQPNRSIAVIVSLAVPA